MSASAGPPACSRALAALGLWLALSQALPPALAQGPPDLPPDALAPAEASIQDVRQALLNLGLENLLLDKVGDQYYVQYENRRYLHEIRAMGKVLSTLAPLLPLDSTLHLYIQSQGVTMTHVAVPMTAYTAFRSGVMGEADFAAQVRAEYPAPPHLFPPDQPLANSLLGHSDLMLQPGYIATQAEGPTIMLFPTWDTYLNHGLRFSTGLRFAMWSGDRLPGGFDYALLDASRLIGGLPLTNTTRLGYARGRYFASNELAHQMMDGMFEVRLTTGLLYNTNPEAVLGLEGNVFGIGRWRFHPLDFILEVGGGRFLGFGASGPTTGEWVRLVRYFGANDFSLAFFRMHTPAAGPDKAAYQFNLEFKLSLGPEEGLRPGVVRATWPPFFAGDLQAGWFIANQVSTNLATNFLKRLYPSYIKTHLWWWKDDNY